MKHLKIILSIILLLIASPVFAANIAVSPSGGGNGLSWSTPATWSTVTLTRGNTYYLMEGTYAGRTLNTAVSGTSYIIIKKATDADYGGLSGWSSSMGDAVCTFTSGFAVDTGYWRIDGVTGGGPTAWETGHGFVYSQAATGDAFVEANGSTGPPGARNGLEILHVKWDATGSNLASGGGDFFYCANGATCVDTYIAYNYVNNLAALFVYGRGLSSNAIVEKNKTGDLCGMWTYNGAHCENVVLAQHDNLEFRYNWFTESVSSGCIVKNETDNPSSNLKIHGNLFTDQGAENSWWYQCNASSCIGWYIIGNSSTSINIQGTGTSSITGAAYNNIFYGFSNAGYLPSPNYNYYTNDTGSPYACDSGEGAQSNLCKSGGCDVTCAGDINPFTNVGADVLTLTGPIAGWPGYNVCASLSCNNYSEHTVAGSALVYNTFGYDMLGNVRGADGVWDRGAYEYGTGTTPPSAQGCTISGGTFK